MQVTSLVQNGSFEMLQTNASQQFGTGYTGASQEVTDWSTIGGYNFVFLPGKANTTGATGVDGNVKL